MGAVPRLRLNPGAFNITAPNRQALHGPAAGLVFVLIRFVPWICMLSLSTKAISIQYQCCRLFTGLMLGSLAAALLSRFVLRWQLLELAAWAAFLFLEVYPKASGWAALTQCVLVRAFLQSLLAACRAPADQPASTGSQRTRSCRAERKKERKKERPKGVKLRLRLRLRGPLQARATEVVLRRCTRAASTRRVVGR
jgi:hypothetical protein